MGKIVRNAIFHFSQHLIDFRQRFPYNIMYLLLQDGLLLV